MNELDQLLLQLSNCGLSDTQSRIALLIINNWINEEYPVMGAIAEIWLQENGLNTETAERDNVKG
jgi:hypothetical protein